jgi:hypothetical protein
MTQTLERNESTRMRQEFEQPPGSELYVGRYSTGAEDLVDAELDRLGRLPANWDAQGAQPIDSRIIEAAKTLVRLLRYEPIGLPKIVPIRNGNLQFEWNENGRTLELEIETPSTIHFLKWDPTANIEEEDLYPIDDSDTTKTLIAWFWGAGIATYG